jgi:ABC-type Fe3+/spermidine/putrescine transport system ATPase subunit
LLDAGCVLQSGPVSSVYLRPANETVARLLGAEIIGYGRAVGPHRIDVGEGVQLAVGGPSLEPCTCVGWSVRPERVRFAHDAPYPARILQVGEVRDGQRSITIQIGYAVFEVIADPSLAAANDFCHIAIDPNALQIWSVG